MAIPEGARIVPFSVEPYSHLAEPLRSHWLQCIICEKVPETRGYHAEIPGRWLGDGKVRIGVGTTCCSEECARQWLATTEPLITNEDTSLPTQNRKTAWIDAYRKAGNYPEDVPLRDGKWLIWLSLASIDRYWLNIRQALEQGKLGNWAKVSTAKQIIDKRPNHVICVYTYDYENKTDIMRIREVLRALGIRRQIPYKTNEETHQLRYGRNYEPLYRA